MPDHGLLLRNLARMRDGMVRHPGLALRPHMKTGKSRDVAALASPAVWPWIGGCTRLSADCAAPPGPGGG